MRRLPRRPPRPARRWPISIGSSPTAWPNAPNETLHFLIWDRDDPGTVSLSVGPRSRPTPSSNRLIRVDAHTGAIPRCARRHAPIHLHHAQAAQTTCSPDWPGSSSWERWASCSASRSCREIVVYAPSMRKLPFAAVRHGRRRAVRWLDIHNLDRHRAGDLDTGGRPHRGHQHLGRPGHQDLAVRPTGRHDRDVSRPADADTRRRPFKPPLIPRAASIRPASPPSSPFPERSSAAGRIMRSSCAATRR